MAYHLFLLCSLCNNLLRGSGFASVSSHILLCDDAV